MLCNLGNHAVIIIIVDELHHLCFHHCCHPRGHRWCWLCHCHWLSCCWSIVHSCRRHWSSLAAAGQPFGYAQHSPHFDSPHFDTRCIYLLIYLILFIVSLSVPRSVRGAGIESRNRLYRKVSNLYRSGNVSWGLCRSDKRCGNGLEL